MGSNPSNYYDFPSWKNLHLWQGIFLHDLDVAGKLETIAWWTWWKIKIPTLQQTPASSIQSIHFHKSAKSVDWTSRAAARPSLFFSGGNGEPRAAAHFGRIFGSWSRAQGEMHGGAAGTFQAEADLVWHAAWIVSWICAEAHGYTKK